MPQLLPLANQLVHHLFYRPDHAVRRRQRLVGVQSQCRGQRPGEAPLVVGNSGHMNPESASSKPSNRSPALWRIQSILAAVASAVADDPTRLSMTPAAMLGFTPTMSAVRAANRSTRSEPPATNSGGPSRTHRFGQPLKLFDGVVLARERDRPRQRAAP